MDETSNILMNQASIELKCVLKRGGGGGGHFEQHI